MAFTHHLKTWPEWFAPVRAGQKPFEIRLDDRNFEIGDILELEEWDPDTKAYTGESYLARVIFIARDLPGLEPGYCAMGIAPYSNIKITYPNP